MKKRNLRSLLWKNALLLSFSSQQPHVLVIQNPVDDLLLQFLANKPANHLTILKNRLNINLKFIRYVKK